MGMDIVFVVLNFNVIDETVDCVDSIIKNIDVNDFHIVVVENGSSILTKNKLKERLSLYERVTIVDSKENLGFARGNNLGIEKAREFNPKYICCTNNDTLLLQKDFYTQLSVAYNKSKAALIGPLVRLRDDSVQIFSCRIKSVNEYQEELEDCIRYFNPGIVERIKKRLRRFETVYSFFSEKKRSRALTSNKTVNPFEERYNVVLHGSCLIFTPVFFDFYNGFNDRTFLYREEEILYVMLKRKGLKTLYCPQISIKHLEDVSTNSQNMDLSKKTDWYLENQIASLKVLIEELSNPEYVDSLERKKE